MTAMTSEFLSYALLYSEPAKKSRKELPRETQILLLDVVDMLAENPNAFPGRTQTIGRDGRIRIYTHPNPALQITFEVLEDTRVLYLLHFVAPQVQVTKPVFISYSHKDAEWLAKLKEFLSPLEEQGLVRMWDDTEIKTGSDWMAEIRRSLESARVAVFLITQSFLNSAFIREKELPVLLNNAQDRGCLVFWVAVSTSTVDDSGLARFQAANDPNHPLDTLPVPDQNRVLKEIYDRMKQAVQPN